ncbi:MAG: hypothetical protein RLZZ164_703 [Actinomycetota bacterium]|jgi:geranylgeranyl diphosphate synthase type I
MDDSKTLIAAIQSELDSFMGERRVEFEQISPELLPMLDYANTLIAGGKRFRGQFCFWAWRGFLDQPSASVSDRHPIAKICAALELFHAAALVHDDVIDQSDTRRSNPSVHKLFEKLHRDSNWSSDPKRFGESAAIILGDLLLAWSSELFGNALLDSPTREIEAACRDQFARMRVEVMAGQYLDILEENSAAGRPIGEAVARANRVMLYKTAKYSIEAPLLIGAAFAGATAPQFRALSAFAIPLGLCFQLRDDVLGVFGDPAITGKPAGDDLREGKRTVLVALTRQALDEDTAHAFDQMLAIGELSSAQIAQMQQQIQTSGALTKTEQLIDELGNEAVAALESVAIDEAAKQQLHQLADQVVNRQH